MDGEAKRLTFCTSRRFSRRLSLEVLVRASAAMLSSPRSRRARATSEREVKSSMYMRSSVQGNYLYAIVQT